MPPWEWEGILENSPEEERKAWKEYYESVKDLPDDVVRWKYEIEADGHHSFFTQTWSGNIHMMKVTERLGFTEIVRKTDYREVNGKKYDAVTFRLDL